MTTVTVSNVAQMRAALANASVTEILVNPGNYTATDHDPNGQWGASGFFVNRNLTIRVNGTVGQKANFYAGVDFAKGLFLVKDGVSVTFDGIGFYNTRSNPNGGNIAGIRMEGLNLTVRNSHFQNCYNGILGAALPGFPAGNLTVENSTFTDNGDLSGSGQEHHIYFEGNSVTVTGSNFSNSGYGHSIKTVTSGFTTVTNTTINDLSAPANSAINVTGGGALTVTGNTITKGGSAENPYIIYYETLRNSGMDGAIQISGNTFNSTYGQTLLLGNLSNVTAVLNNNILNGASGVFDIGGTVRGLASMSGNTLNGSAFNQNFAGLAEQGTSGNDIRAFEPFGTYYTPSNHYNGGAGNDIIVSGVWANGPDVFMGGDGADTISGGAGSDFIYGDAGDDTLFSGLAESGQDYIFGGTGNDKIYTTPRSFGYKSNSLYADGGEGNDLIDGRFADDMTVTGGAGDDILIGSFNPNVSYNWLNGGTGSDILFGGAGQDNMIDGGPDNDTGIDTAVYQGAYGTDLTVEGDTYFPAALKWVRGLNAAGTLEVGDGEAMKNIEFIQFTNGSYEIATATFTAGLIRVDINPILAAPIPVDPSAPILPFDVLTIENGVTHNGTTATAGAGNQTARIGWGETAMALGDGNDTYVFDAWYGGSTPPPAITETSTGGIDTVAFRPFDQAIYTLAANVEIGVLWQSRSTGGGDGITGNSLANLLADLDNNNPYITESTQRATLNGGDGDDILYGGNANDTLIGGNGTDTAVMRGNRADYTLGAGNTTITDNATANGNEGTDSLSGIEQIRFADGTLVLATNVFTSQSNGSSGIAYAGGTYSFATGRWTVGSGDPPLTLVGTANAETLTGASNNDTITGLGGDDTLIGNGGDDTFRVTKATDGFDAIDGGSGNDRIIVTVDNAVVGLRSLTGVELISANGFAGITIAGSALADTLNFSAVTLTNIVAINAGDGNDNIIGSTAADTITGGAGNDTLSGGNGNDILEGGAGTNSLNGGADNDTARYLFARATYSVTDNGGGTYTISGNGATDTLTGIESVQFSDGTFAITSLTGIPYPTTGASVQATGYSTGTAGNDRIVTDNIANTFTSSGDGSDWITLANWNINADAGSGNDVIDFFADGLTVTGGTGNDWFLFDRTKLDIPNWVTNWATVTDYTDGQDKIAILNNAAITNFAAIQPFLSQSGADVLISMTGSPTIRLQNVSLASLDASDFFFGPRLSTFTGTAAGETLNGGDDFDTLIGNGGDDTLTGGNGNDVFSYSGTANGFDTINGNAGSNDRVVATAAGTRIGLVSFANIEKFSGGGFADVGIVGSAAANNFNFSTINFEGIAFVDGGDGNDTITMGSSWDDVRGGNGADIINTGDGDDRLAGGAGNDTLNGGNGTDTADYSSGTGAQTINLTLTAAQTISSGNVDTLSNIENVIGGSGVDTITGNGVANRLEGGNGNDLLRGNGGNDTLIGGAGTTDTADFAGLIASYTISTSGGVTIITDNQAGVDGDDGSDTLTQVERARFKGGVIQALATPVVLDLDGDGINLVHRDQSRARFDWDGDGKRDQTGWVGKGDGKVSSFNELSFVDDKPGAKSDLDGLTAFDSNGDGKLSALDSAWSSFSVWVDRNGDGPQSKRELLSMQAAGVASIDLTPTAVNRDWAWGDNLTINTGSFERLDGMRQAFALSYRPGDTGRSSAARIAELGDPRVSQMVQAMASFAPTAGEPDTIRRPHEGRSLEFFA